MSEQTIETAGGPALVERMTLPELARIAWEIALTEANEAEAERHSEHNKKLIDFLERFLTAYNLPFTVDGESLSQPEITIDGITLCAIASPGRHAVRDRWVAVMGNCPRCGQRVPSHGINTLAELGMMLTEFQPNHQHAEQDCPVAIESRMQAQLEAEAKRTLSAIEVTHAEFALLIALRNLTEDRLAQRWAF